MSTPSTAIEVRSSREVGLWAGAVVVAGLVVPGLGLALAVVLAFTRLRSVDGRARWGLVALGAAVLALQLVGLLAGGGPALHTTPAVPVTG